MRIAVLGAGGIARQHLRAAADLGVETAHICGLRLEPAHHPAWEFGIARVSSSPARAGKHVLSEKPLCRTTA